MILPLVGLSLAITGAPSPRTLAWRDVVEPQGEREQAAAEFAAGEQAYAAGDFAAAVEHFSKAQELVPHPFTAYNLGLALARAGRTVDAWQTFDRLAREASDPAHRADAERQQARLRERVAFVRVDAPAGTTVCLDGAAVPAGETRTVEPGPHRVVVDDVARQVDLRGGETRQVEVRGNAAPPRAVKPLLGVAIGAGVVALGTGLGPLFTDDRNAQVGLALTAGAAASVAVGTTIAALVLHTRRRAKTGRSRSAPCPAS